MYENNEKSDIIVLERSCHANKIFASVMKEYNRLNDCEYLMYEMIFNYITLHMPKINGIIYLDCEIDKAMNRIKYRNRNGEQNVDSNYQISLQNAHNQWIDRLYNKANNVNKNININQNINGHSNDVNNNIDNTTWDEFDSNVGILRWPAKDFLDNVNDLKAFDTALINFIEKQQNHQTCK